MVSMSGIYIHIPFCKSKCHYCDFFSVTKSEGREEFAALLIEELEFRSDYLINKQVDTIYFGGGTPTLLHPSHLETVLKHLRKMFTVNSEAEITIEANPDDLSPGLVTSYLESGFNRMSIGTQSFFDEHLKLMNRRHDAAQAIEAVRMASAGGFRNISLDLIYGIPGMTAGQWEQNLTIAAGLPADHISAYHLTIEPKTRFGRLKKAGLFSEIPDEESVEQYQKLLKILGEQGFEQYEISNFARDKRYSRHNTKYWTGDTYLGLGPSAHSFDGSCRHWNPSGLAKYTADIRSKKLPKGEVIEQSMHRNEYVMTRLRTAAGIEKAGFQSAFGEAAWLELLVMADERISKGYLIYENEKLRFDTAAWFRSDGILSDLFVV
jgi:oxygen-independent coproporphyrinogen-3 oxidase